jgi:hypothetical protein
VVLGGGNVKLLKTPYTVLYAEDVPLHRFHSEYRDSSDGHTGGRMARRQLNSDTLSLGRSHLGNVTTMDFGIKMPMKYKPTQISNNWPCGLL